MALALLVGLGMWRVLLLLVLVHSLQTSQTAAVSTRCLPLPLPQLLAVCNLHVICSQFPAAFYIAKAEQALRMGAAAH